MNKNAIYVASTKELAGKSLVTIALASIAKDLGQNVGYFKPVGVESATNEKGEPLDEDAETIRTILKIKDDASSVCPLVIRKDKFIEQFTNIETSEITNKLEMAYRTVSRGKELILIEGPPTLSVGAFIGCPVPKMAVDFNAKILLVEKAEDDLVVDDILQARDYCTNWKVKLYGVILNQIPSARMLKAKNIVKPAIEKNGIKVIGIIPEDRTINALTINEIYGATGGKILAGKDGMEKTVSTVLIGAMTPESAVRYFRKAKNELVITGGDRTDIILAALEAGVSALVLTGNLHPSVKIFPRADELKVPIILVPFDTYTTLQLIQRIVGRIKPTDNARINRVKRLVKENMDWKQIFQNGKRSN
jgi:BioD-like phosphotransacetylase family protein